jgi:hypothetical protein
MGEFDHLTPNFRLRSLQRVTSRGTRVCKIVMIDADEHLRASALGSSRDLPVWTRLAREQLRACH